MIQKRVFMALACLGSASMFAQPPHGEMMRHPGPGGPPPGDPGMIHFARDTKVVKGQPYSADLVNESIQVLGDGTKISTKTAGTVYRDTDGRTRREETGAQGRKSITIFDPVASVSLTLNSSDKTASKQSIHLPPADMQRRSPGPATAGPGPDHAKRGGRGGPDRQNRVSEDLGNQAIEGVQAQGRRTTTTIPAGTMGNDRDIKVIDEVWMSPDLQVVVQSRHSDPWTGEVTYKLSNIRRADQSHTLFEAPADYQVKESGGFRRQGAPPPARQD